MTTLPAYLTPLARLDEGRTYAADPRERPVPVLAEETYGPVRLVVESPQRVARALVLPYLEALAAQDDRRVRFVRHLGVLCSVAGEGGPRPVALDRLTTLLERDVLELPDAPTAGDPYRRLRRWATLDQPAYRAHLAEAVEAVVRLVPAYQPRQERQRRPQRSARLTTGRSAGSRSARASQRGSRRRARSSLGDAGRPSSSTALTSGWQRRSTPGSYRRKTGGSTATRLRTTRPTRSYACLTPARDASPSATSRRRRSRHGQRRPSGRATPSDRARSRAGASTSCCSSSPSGSGGGAADARTSKLRSRDAGPPVGSS